MAHTWPATRTRQRLSDAGDTDFAESLLSWPRFVIIRDDGTPCSSGSCPERWTSRSPCWGI